MGMADVYGSIAALVNNMLVATDYCRVKTVYTAQHIGSVSASSLFPVDLNPSKLNFMTHTKMEPLDADGLLGRAAGE